MQNQFDVSAYPDAVPSTLTAGSRWAWTRSDITDAYPTASYTLKFRFSLLADPYTDYSIVASKVSSAHVVEVATSVTSGYAAGDYSWFAVIVRDSDSEEVTVDTGFVTIQPDMGAAPGDTRTWVARVLAAIRATIEGTASKEQSGYSIGGRSLSLRTPGELLELEREFHKRWKQEQAEINRAAGRTAVSRVLIKMSA
jgi:hypothetical protein